MPNSSSVKIISINTWKGDGDYFSRMEILATQLKELLPNIIACQECLTSEDGEINTLRFLAERLEMNFVFTPARYKMRKVGSKEIGTYSGMGLLSSYPLQLVSELTLPSTVEDGGRKVQFVTIGIAEARHVLVVNVHLTHLIVDKTLKIRQLNAIIDEIKLQSGFYAILVCGDFNAELDSAAMRYFNHALKTADCYMLGSGKEPRFDNETRNDFQVDQAIDHILVMPDEGGCYPVCSGSRLVLFKADRDTNLYASDHAGISTILHLPVKNSYEEFKSIDH